MKLHTDANATYFTTFFTIILCCLKVTVIKKYLHTRSLKILHGFLQMVKYLAGRVSDEQNSCNCCGIFFSSLQ